MQFQQDAISTELQIQQVLISTELQIRQKEIPIEIEIRQKWISIKPHKLYKSGDVPKVEVKSQSYTSKEVTELQFR